MPVTEPQVRCLLIAADDGSCEAIRPLARDSRFSLHSIERRNAGDAGYWNNVYRSNKGLAGIVVGTSDSAEGRAIEAAARLAATRVGLKIAAIEDYAGNYADVPDSNTGLLIAESDLSGQLYQERLGNLCPPVEIFGPVRYDQYRSTRNELRAGIHAAWNHAREATQILWAGQPESKDSLETLRRIAPAIRALDATLIVKTHPRDPLHRQSAYENLLDQLHVKHSDASALSVAASMDKAPRLVMTQFSSVAIEAGFYGIPALHLLYEDVGGRQLQSKKGYSVPLHCRRGASFSLFAHGAEQDVLRKALFDEAAREAAIRRFDDFFATETTIAPVLAKRLLEFIR